MKVRVTATVTAGAVGLTITVTMTRNGPVLHNLNIRAASDPDTDSGGGGCRGAQPESRYCLPLPGSAAGSSGMLTDDDDTIHGCASSVIASHGHGHGASPRHLASDSEPEAAGRAATVTADLESDSVVLSESNLPP